MSASPTTPSVGAAVLQAGDVVFQTSRSAQSVAVQLATRSSLSHMGIVLPRAGRLVVFEAVGPVKATEVDAWVASGVDGRVVVKRLKRPGGLSRDEVARLTTEAEAMLGRPYDTALSWGDERLYCSELVWKVLHRALGVEVGQMGRLGDFDLSHPVVAEKLRERYWVKLPLAEVVISPAVMAASPLLEAVVGR